jgi:integrase/recombinase XerD
MPSLYIHPRSPYYYVRIFDSYEPERKKKRKSFPSKIKVTEADWKNYFKAKEEGKKYKPNGNKETKELLQRLNTGLLERKIFAETGIKSKPSITLKAGLAEFLSVKSYNYSNKTIQLKQLAVRHLIEAAGDKAIADYNEHDYAKLLKYFKMKKFKPAGINIYTAHLSPIFNYFVERKYSEKNIIKVTAPPKGEPEPISFKEMQLILNYFKNKKTDDGERQYQLIYFLLLTGMRISSALQVSNDDIFYEEELLRIKNVKADRVFYFPLYPELYNFLKDEMKISGNEDEVYLLFPYAQNDSPKFFSKATRDLFKLKKIKRAYSFHNLRDTFTSWLANKDVDRGMIKLLLDHSSQKVTDEYYTRIEAKTLKRQFKKIRFRDYVNT